MDHETRTNNILFRHLSVKGEEYLFLTRLMKLPNGKHPLEMHLFSSMSAKDIS